ncbi:YggT family protein [Microbacterium sp. YY-03]|uniref:YggT family protein n=1 Tax=Microbacterium sp. YY-03 TaxID=3421636 RepID=UPI003D1845C0
MGLLQVAMAIVSYAIMLYMMALFARFILDLIPMFSRDWRPKGLGLVFAEFIFTITDPPLKFVRKLVKPIRLGAVQLDLSFMIVMIVCLFAYRITFSLAA